MIVGVTEHFRGQADSYQYLGVVTVWGLQSENSMDAYILA
jgi:hypothetical protein